MARQCWDDDICWFCDTLHIHLYICTVTQHSSGLAHQLLQTSGLHCSIAAPDAAASCHHCMPHWVCIRLLLWCKQTLYTEIHYALNNASLCCLYGHRGHGKFPDWHCLLASVNVATNRKITSDIVKVFNIITDTQDGTNQFEVRKRHPTTP